MPRRHLGRPCSWLFASTWIPALALTSAAAWAGECPPTPGQGKICTANDFNVTSAVLSPGNGCTEGELFDLDVRVGLEATANERYDIGFFAGDAGGPVFDGSSCTLGSLVPLEPPFDPLSGNGGYRDLDGDACGDVLESDGIVYRDIALTDVLCQDTNGDGNLDLSATVTWSNNASQDVCTDPDDPASFFPNQSSKCQFTPSFELPVVVEPDPSIVVDKVAVPSSLPAPGGNVRFFVSVTNTSSSTDPLTIEAGGLVDDIHGDLTGRGTCRLPRVLAPGETYRCVFIASVTQTETDTVTVTAVDDEGETVTDSDDATVTIEPAQASIEVSKTASPQQLAEPGGAVSYGVVVTNTSNVPVELTTLEDDLYGDVFTKGTCQRAPPVTLGPRESLVCDFSEQVSGQPGDVITDTITANATAPDGTPLTADASASVVILDIPSEILGRKLAIPRAVQEPGGSVRFVFGVQNTSPVDTVTLTSLVDDIYGDLNGQGTCSVPQTLSPGGVYLCRFTGAVSGSAGDSQIDVITVEGVDDDGSDVAAQAAAEVIITAGPVPADIEVRKTANPTVLTEPGGDVNFEITLFNTSPDVSVTVDSLVDDVHGDLNGQGTCSVPIVLQPLGSAGDTYQCSFTAEVTGSSGDIEVDTVTAAGEDENGNPVGAENSATVTIKNAPPSVALTKSADPTELREPGGDVIFTVRIVNTSAADTLTLNSLRDSDFGDLDGLGTCSMPQTLAPAAVYECQFPGEVQGPAGSVHTNLATLSATSDDGELLTARDDAEVTIVNVEPTIRARKLAIPTAVQEPGGTVGFLFAVQNTSTLDTVTLNSLVDDVYGDLDGRGTCSVPQSLSPGGIYVCAFTGPVSGNAGDRQVDTITVEGVDDDGTAVSAQASAEVIITDAPVPADIEVLKTANPTVVTEPGGDVSFGVSIYNTSPDLSVTVESLVDDVHGDLNGQGTCSVPVTLQPRGTAGDEYSCSFTAEVTGNSGDTEVDTVTASGEDENGRAVSDEDSASVSIVGEPLSLIDVEKATNGQDADVAPGPRLDLGSQVTWTYVVSNPGDTTLEQVTLVDDQGVVPVLEAGDTNADGKLKPGETWIYRAQGTAVAGLYANLASVNAQDPQQRTVRDEDPSHYYSLPPIPPPDPRVDIEKTTNGVDADVPPGPILRVGAIAEFAYLVTNTGNLRLRDIAVVDDQGETVTCPSGNPIPELAPGEQETCSAQRTVVAGPYANLGSVSATATTDETVSDSDPSHHLGVPSFEPDLGIDIAKATNGQDADQPTGPRLPVGSAAEFTYAVTNIGSLFLRDVAVTDSEGETVTCPGGNPIPLLRAGQRLTCTASKQVTVGQYSNIGSATGKGPSGALYSDSDPSHHIGIATLSLIDVEKATNGVDADLPPGPQVELDSTVTWTYVVTNPGDTTLDQVTLVDDQGVTPVFQGGDSNDDGKLQPNETWTYLAQGTTVAGLYTNLATVTARDPDLQRVEDEDPSHYFALQPIPPADPRVDIEKTTNGVDADTAPGPLLLIGKTADFAYIVTNTGNVDLRNLAVSDDQGETVTCPSGNPIPLLEPGAQETCTAQREVVAGQYANVGSVTADALENVTVSDSDPSHHFGVRTFDPELGIDIEKATNGEDADSPTGPELPVDTNARFTYKVTNTGQLYLRNVLVTDSEGETVTCPSGNPIPLLRAGESETCTARKRVTVGQYSNIGSATGTGPLGALYSDSDPSHHFGREVPGIPTLSSIARAILLLVLSALGAYILVQRRRIAGD